MDEIKKDAYVICLWKLGKSPSFVNIIFNSIDAAESYVDRKRLNITEFGCTVFRLSGIAIGGGVR